MSARSIQAGRLGYELACTLDLRRVEIHWSGTKKVDSFGGWRVEWLNGPTVRHMRLLVKQYAKRFPAVPVADLGYDRCSTPLAEAITLLLYIDRDRSWADGIETSLVYSAFDAVDWPERADQVWHDRARALLRYTPAGGCSSVTAYAVRALAEHARNGWDYALAWLDRLAALAEASNVINLASRRETA
jgi:hypothetical protein